MVVVMSQKGVRNALLITSVANGTQLRAAVILNEFAQILLTCFILKLTVWHGRVLQ